MEIFGQVIWIGIFICALVEVVAVIVATVLLAGG